MNYDELQDELFERRIRVRLSPSGGLQVTNASALTDDLRQALKQHKPALIRMLNTPVLDLVMQTFGGVLQDENGRRMKYVPGDGGMFGNEQ